MTVAKSPGATERARKAKAQRRDAVRPHSTETKADVAAGPAMHWTSGDARLPHEQVSATPAQRADAAQALRSLRRLGFNNAAIRALLRELREEADIHAMITTWRSPVNERKTLQAVAALASELKQRLRELSPRVSQPLAAEMARHVMVAMDELPPVLFALSLVAADLAREAPEQSRRSSRVGIVARVARVWSAEERRGRISAAAGSPFAKACAAAFWLAGVAEESGRDPSATAAIRAYLSRVRVASAR